ncbi:hypothetical protein FD754_011932 [Muntiacus muntjak]|uniref:Synaptonemal complex central element protein 3 n=1 Tax=Muntiacus muntjak TaxID=9888 RepID=A0A5N3VF95_MUNMU|nr:hypothetical protein FD754_011932 [Muntiacus muntjak]
MVCELPAQNYPGCLLRGRFLGTIPNPLHKNLFELERAQLSTFNRLQATWMAYDMVVMRTNPTLAESMRRLEDAFLNCKEEMEKNWQELLSETKHTQ